jgi:hypothetical protein
MIDFLRHFDHAEPVLFALSIIAAASMVIAVIVERSVYGLQRIRRRMIEHRYAPLIRRALGGDAEARHALVTSPSRHRLPLAWMLIQPLIEDRDPNRIAATRGIAQSMAILEIADRYLRSGRWWRRALALRALGLLQARDHTRAVVAALDDPEPGVRAAALDALTDLRDPASVSAVVVRLNDPSLQRGRRVAALEAFGPASEPFVLDLAHADPRHLVNYARALAVCGTSRSRPDLRRWAHDTRAEVRAAAFEALARVGLDAASARTALDALDHDSDVRVRAMAARALEGWPGDAAAAGHLARHLDDEWPVAVRSARALQSMGEPGLTALTAFTPRGDLAGTLARQMLWQPGTLQ